MLKERIAAEVKEPQVLAEWRASEVGECETFLCHVRLGHSPLPFVGRVRHMLDDGLMHERDVVKRIVSKAISVRHSYVDGQLEVSCVSKDTYPYDDGDIRVVGHPDGILDLPKSREFELDYADEGFRWGSRFYLLEVTAPNHFAFLRVERNHLRAELWRKFVQIQMYLNSEEFRTYGDCCVAVVKNKNTSALYEEGISLDAEVITETVDKLKRVEDFVHRDEISQHRCSDWRRHYCRFRHLCYAEEWDREIEGAGDFRGGEILVGESLGEAEQLLEAAELWLKGKALRTDGEDLIDEARQLFRETLEQYGARGLTVGQVKAQMVDSTRSVLDSELLRQKYPNIYEEFVHPEVSRYVRVSRA